MIKAENLTKRFYDTVAVDHIHAEIHNGSVFGLIGTNGAGKSTTMKAIMGLIPVKSGKTRFDGKEITNLDTKNMVQSGIILSPEPAGVSALLGHG